MKTCTKCKIEKCHGDFHKHATAKDRKNPWCKLCVSVYNHTYNKLEKRKQKVREYQKSLKFKETRKRYMKTETYIEYRKSDRWKKYQMKYEQDTQRQKTDSYLEWRRSYNHRNKDNPKFTLPITLRNRLNRAIKNNQRAGSAVKDLGCTIDELKIYLQSKFTDGMTWENHSHSGWHIDHIIPMSSFDLTDREQLLKACHYTNLQPLWAIDNYKKGAKIKNI